MNSILEGLGLPQRHDRLAALIASLSDGFTDLQLPSDDYKRLCICYAKLVIANYLRDKCRDCPVGLQELTKIVTIPRPPQQDFPVPCEPTDIAEHALVEMIDEGYAEEHNTDVLGPLYVVNDESLGMLSSLTLQMYVWACDAVGAVARLNADRYRSPRRSPPSRDALLCRDFADTLGLLLAEPLEWAYCPKGFAAWWLANEGVIDRDGQGRYRVVDVDRAQKRLAELIDALKRP